GQYQGLLDPRIIARKSGEEAELKAKIDADPQKKEAYGTAWQRIGDAEILYAAFEREYALLEQGHAFDSHLFRIARHLIRLAEEKPKPNAERLREYRDSNLESLEFELFSPAPIHAELEGEKLAGSLSFLAQNLGGDHPLVGRVFAGQA